MIKAHTAEEFEKANEILRNATIFLGYKAGLKPTAKAVEETRVARDAGINLQHYVGRFERLFVNKRGEQVLTLWVYDRGAPGNEGRYRSFNANLGTLRVLSVIQSS